MGDDITIGVTEIVNNIEVTAQPNDQIVDISVIDNADEVTLNITPTVIEINVNKGSSYARWGTIYGNLTDQTDLTNALILKADLVDGKVPAYQLPSFVDDVVEVANYAALPAMGEIGKIYVTLDNNKIYRWSGSIYIEIASNNAIWGAITGTLSNQTDLQNALDLKQNSLSWMSPLSVAGGTVSISYSGVSTNGALSSTDWNTFNGKANDNAVVHLTGDETISGTKTFSEDIFVNGITVGRGNGNLNSNTAFGKEALSSQDATGAGVNTAIGYGTLKNNTFGSQNTAIGVLVLSQNTTGTGNVGIGIQAIGNNTTGNNNIGISYDSLYSNTTGDDNIAIGYQAGSGNTNGSNNIIFGTSALVANQTGNNNIAIGYEAGRYTNSGGSNTTSNGSIYIGAGTVPNSNNQTNQIVIGLGAVGAGSNTVTIGNTSITTTRLRGEVQGGSFKKDGGTSSQFLKADGSVDSTTYATDSNVVHKTGAETITGKKTFDSSAGSSDAIEIISNSTGKAINISHPSGGTAIFIDNPVGTGLNVNNIGTNSFGIAISNPNTGRAISMSNSSSGTGIWCDNVGTGTGIYSYNSTSGYGIRSLNQSTGTGFYSVNESTGIGFNSNNSSTGKGFESTNSSTGQGFYSLNSGLGTGIYSTNTAAGKGIESYNSSTGIGFYSGNTGTGTALYLNNQSSGKNLVLMNTTSATGMPFTIQKQGLDVFTINDAGVATANSFINVNTSTGYGISVTNTGGGVGIYSNNTSGTGFLSVNNSNFIGIESINYGTNAGIRSRNDSTGRGIESQNISTGYGIYSTNTGNGRGIFCENTSTGIGVFLSNSGSGKNLLLNNTAPATGMPFTVQKGGVDKFTINDAGGVYAAGSVGIGTTSPSSLLHLKTSGSTAQSIESTGSANYASLGFLNTTTGYGYDIGFGGSSSIAPNSFYIYGGSSASVKFLINSGGNVGIGTTSPESGWKFDVAGIATMGGTAGNGRLYVSTDETTNGTTYIQARNLTVATPLYYTASKHTFDTNVGIGTTSPAEKLDVQGSILLNQSAGSYIRYQYNGTNDWVFGENSGESSRNFNLYNYNTASINFSVNRSSGNVGIGTTSPGVSLEVNGLIRSIPVYNNTTATAANLVVSSGGTFERSTSSLKYKKEVRDYDKGLETLLQIRPVYYKGKSESDGDKQFAGLIAEEIHDLGLTEFVQYAEDGTPDALAYTHMIALLVKGIQELKAEIEILKNK